MSRAGLVSLHEVKLALLAIANSIRSPHFVVILSKRRFKLNFPFSFCEVPRRFRFIHDVKFILPHNEHIRLSNLHDPV